MKLIVITKACNWTCLNLQERWLTPSVTSEYQGVNVGSKFYSKRTRSRLKMGADLFVPRTKRCDEDVVRHIFLMMPRQCFLMRDIH